MGNLKEHVNSALPIDKAATTGTTFRLPPFRTHTSPINASVFSLNNVGHECSIGSTTSTADAETHRSQTHLRESRLLTTYEIATRRRSATVKQERQSFSNPVPRHEQSPFSNSSDGPASCGSTAVDRRTPLHTVETFERESTSASSLTVCLAEVGSPQILYLPTSTMSKMRARRHYTHTNSTSSALTSAFSLLYVLAQHAVLCSLHVGIIRCPVPPTMSSFPSRRMLTSSFPSHMPHARAVPASRPAQKRWRRKLLFIPAS
jgi:hypothetical protein